MITTLICKSMQGVETEAGNGGSQGHMPRAEVEPRSRSLQDSQAQACAGVWQSNPAAPFTLLGPPAQPLLAGARPGLWCGEGLCSRAAQKQRTVREEIQGLQYLSAVLGP